MHGIDEKERKVKRRLKVIELVKKYHSELAVVMEYYIYLSGGGGGGCNQSTPTCGKEEVNSAQ